MMSRRMRLPLSLALCLAVLLAVTGCSNLPTKPETALQPESGMTAATSGAPAEVLGLPLLGGSTSNATTKSAVVGILGGVVSVGDFTVVIPPLALTRTATVTVSQPDLTHPVVNLSISPKSANKFLLPVLLIADAERMNYSLLSAAYMSYYNPATRQWEPVAGCSASILDLTLTAPLSHFSTYRVSVDGKAGW